MREIKAVVVHWDAGRPKNGNIEGLMDWMRNNRDPGIFYHRFVSGIRSVIGATADKVVYHCGHIKYTKFATEFFGEMWAPSYIHTKDKPHLRSPNQVTIGICILHDKVDGSYNDLTLKTAAKECARYLRNSGLDTDALLRHSDIVGTGLKKCPKAFVEDEFLWKSFKVKVRLELDKLNRKDEYI